jgi:DNA-binding response OmpR family regulator
MASEAILVVDDKPVSQRLSRILLINEGYKVITAAGAEEAMELLRGFRPDLALIQVHLLDAGGLEWIRRLKQDERMSGVPILAAASKGAPPDEQRAIEAGCDAYIGKPAGSGALAVRIRELLDSRCPQPALASDEFGALRARFLAEGREKTRELLLRLDGQFDPAEAARPVHQWCGTAGLLGYGAIGRLAREAEALLLERPLDNSQLRESLTNLLLAFSSPREAREAPLPEMIVQTLAGKRIAAIAFPPNEAERLSSALERAQAHAVFFAEPPPAASPDVLACHLTLFHVGNAGAGSPQLEPSLVSAGHKPLVLAGPRDALLALTQPVQAAARGFLMDSWQPEEALVRLSLALAYPATKPAITRDGDGSTKTPAGAAARHNVVIADDDPAALALVRTALENFGMDCYLAADGGNALEQIRRVRPQAAVLDVNMPLMDGYELLAAIRREGLPVRVLLLTARQQESDILRGFALGADDYVVKPFSPMELVARLQRLLAR